MFRQACSGGGGCGVSITMQASTVTTQNGTKTGVIVGSVLGSVFLVALICLGVLYYFRQKKRRALAEELRVNYDSRRGSSVSSLNMKNSHVALDTFSSRMQRVLANIK